MSEYPPPPWSENTQPQPLRVALLDWYSLQKRDLPWRQTSDPYAIWLSEMMLQQTRVETVIPYYHKFLERFPTIKELAEADLADVLAMWSGLGYYRRARHLHAASLKVVELFDGRLPNDLKQILSLPGIGRYTAGAILSIAFQRQLPVVDGNVHRVLARIFQIPHAVGTSSLDRLCWEIAEVLIKGERPGDLNQALMELGAMICTPRRPTCLLCPVSDLCGSFLENQQEQFPIPKAPKNVKEVDVLWAAVRRSGKILLLRRPPDGLFAGLWELPGLYLSSTQTPCASMLEQYLSELGLHTSLSTTPNTHTHILTHRKLNIQLFQTGTVKGKVSLPREDWRWIHPETPPNIALSSITQKILRTLSR